MYKAFNLPYDFLSREYTPEEKEKFHEDLYNHIEGQTLNEELNDAQKRKVDSWMKPSAEVERTHHEVFGNNDRIEIPYEHPTEVLDHNQLDMMHSRGVSNEKVHHRVVADHLYKNGYKVTDYSKGLAEDTSTGRVIGIGKALSASGGDSKLTAIKSAPKYQFDPITKTHVKDAKGNKIVTSEAKSMSVSQVYAADPIRAATKSGGLKIVMTKNPYDVAGCSTDRGWSSCMNMAGGENSHYLKHDIHHGTITAYITHQSDDGIKNPIGRINLKRFNPINGGKPIYRPEESSYGTTPRGFRSQVEKWAETNYPTHESTPTYTKESSLYNDDGKNILPNPKFKAPEHINHEETQKHILNHLKDAVSAHEDAMQHLLQKDPYADFNDDGIDHTNAASKALSMFVGHDEKTKSNIDKLADHSFHAIRVGTAIDDGNTATRHDARIDKYEDNTADKAWKAYTHAALQNVDLANHLSDKQLANHLTSYNKAAHDGDTDYTDADLSEGFRDAHDKLISEAFKRISHKSEVEPELHQATDDTLRHYANNPVYHTQMHMEHNHLFASAQPIMKTKNPRIIDSLMHVEHDDSYSPYQSFNDLATLKHMGEHADSKLVHSFSDKISGMDSDDAEYAAKHFVSGLNHNQHGEKHQIDAVNKLYLSGGHSVAGALIPSEIPATNKMRIRDIMKGDDNYLREPGSSDEQHNHLFNAIARHSNKPHVLKHIASREDVPQEVKDDAIYSIGRVNIHESIRIPKNKIVGGKSLNEIRQLNSR